MRPQSRKGEDGDYIEGDFNGMVLVKVEGTLPAKVRDAERERPAGRGVGGLRQTQPGPG